MALSTDFSFGIFATNGNTMVFTDTTPAYSANTTGGYGTPNIARSSITQTRLKIGNYPAIQFQTILSEGETLTQYRQYIKTAGSSHVYDNKTITLGNYFIPPISGLTVIAGDEFTDTGVYVPYITPATFLPTTNTTQLVLSITQVGLSSILTIVPDLVFDLQYEVYGAIVAAPFVSIEGMMYIVKGASGTASLNSNVYRPGEVFIGDGTHSVTVSGAATVASLACMTEKTIVTTYNLETSAYELNITRLVQRCKCNCNSQLEIANIYDIIIALQYQTYTNAVSFQQATDLINIANTKILNMQNCF